jgi:hypothetical protein
LPVPFPDDTINQELWDNLSLSKFEKGYGTDRCMSKLTSFKVFGYSFDNFWS